MHPLCTPEDDRHEADIRKPLFQNVIAPILHDCTLPLGGISHPLADALSDLGTRRAGAGGAEIQTGV